MYKAVRKDYTVSMKNAEVDGDLPMIAAIQAAQVAADLLRQTLGDSIK